MEPTQPGIACRATYLADMVQELKNHWPENRTANIVCHGHSVPSGYFATPMVDTFHAYPHLLHRALKERFPFAVINVIVTAIGGENSQSGSGRMEEALCHRPSLVTIDYGLNDRSLGLAEAMDAWASMVEAAQARGAKVLLLTPTWDAAEKGPAGQSGLWQHAEQIRALAREYGVALADSYEAIQRYTEAGGSLHDLLSWPNHPNSKGHELVKNEIMRWFPY